MSDVKCAVNTDRELWRREPGDYYSPSIHVTIQGGIGMNCGGHVFVAPVEAWHAAMKARLEALRPTEQKAAPADSRPYDQKTPEPDGQEKPLRMGEQP